MFSFASTNQIAGPGTYAFAGWLFLRLLGMIYFAAFLSLATQITGLVGVRGILPAVEFLHSRRHWGPSRFWRTPTLCWLNTSDWFLCFLCWSGVALSLLLMAGVIPLACLILLWLCYLSLFE